MLALTLVLLIGVGFGALIEMEYPNSSGLPEGVTRADQLMIFFIFEKMIFFSNKFCVFDDLMLSIITDL